MLPGFAIHPELNGVAVTFPSLHATPYPTYARHTSIIVTRDLRNAAVLRASLPGSQSDSNGCSLEMGNRAPVYPSGAP